MGASTGRNWLVAAGAGTPVTSLHFMGIARIPVPVPVSLTRSCFAPTTAPCGRGRACEGRSGSEPAFSVGDPQMSVMCGQVSPKSISSSASGSICLAASRRRGEEGAGHLSAPCRESLPLSSARPTPASSNGKSLGSLTAAFPLGNKPGDFLGSPGGHLATCRGGSPLDIYASHTPLVSNHTPLGLPHSHRYHRAHSLPGAPRTTCLPCNRLRSLAGAVNSVREECVSDKYEV